MWPFKKKEIFVPRVFNVPPEMAGMICQARDAYWAAPYRADCAAKNHYLGLLRKAGFDGFHGAEWSFEVNIDGCRCVEDAP